MDQASLVIEQIEAGNRFLKKFELTTPVVVAFWRKDAESNRYCLYVASDRFNTGHLGAASAEVLRVAKELQDPNFNPFQVQLVGLNDPLVRSALSFYTTHPPKIPVRIQERSFGGVEVEDLYLVQGPTGEYTMPSGREVLHQIIDEEAAFFQQHGTAPRKMRLPVLMAYDLAKCGRDELGDLSGRVFKDGITVFEREGFHGMNVEIVRDRNAVLGLE